MMEVDTSLPVPPWYRAFDEIGTYRAPTPCKTDLD
jgi:hypothetical protein